MDTVTCDSKDNFISLIRQLNLSISLPRDIFYNKDTEVHCKLKDHSSIYPIDRTFKLYDLYFHLRSVELEMYKYVRSSNLKYDEVPEKWDYDRIVQLIIDVENLKFDDSGEQVVITRNEWDNGIKDYRDCVIYDTFTVDNSIESKYKLVGVLYSAGTILGSGDTVSIFSRWSFSRSNDNSFVTMMPHDEFMFRFSSDWHCVYGYEKRWPQDQRKSWEMEVHSAGPSHWIHDHYQ